jgi:hypothetical protein
MVDRQQMQVRVCPSVEVFLSRSGDLYLLPAADDMQQRLPAPWGVPFHAVLELCEQGTPIDTALTTIDDFEQRATLQAVAVELQELGILVPACSLDSGAPEWHRYDRQIRWFLQRGCAGVQAQRELRNSSVLIIGLGGVGGAVAHSLARAGVGSITGVDHDEVEEVNLPRQSLYHVGDVGRRKVDVFVERIREITPTCNVVGVQQHAATSRQIADLISSCAPHVVVGSADTPADSFSRSLADACHHARTAFVVAGQRVPEIIAGPMVIPGLTPCMDCCGVIRSCDDEHRAVMRELNTWRTSSGFVVPALGVADEIAGAMIASDVLALLTATHRPALAGVTLHLDISSMATRHIVHQPRATCMTCSPEDLRRVA